MKQTAIKIFPVLASLLSLASCLKKDSMNIDPKNTNSVIMITNTGDNQASVTAPFPRFYSDLGSLGPGDSSKFNINISYAGANGAPEDITVNLVLDTAALSAYNTAEGTSYVAPPSTVLRFPSSVVIKKGTQMAQVKATVINSPSFDFNVSYGLPLKISSVSTGIISGNLGKAVYSFGVRNLFDGHYSLKGYTLRAGDPVRTGNFTYPKGMDLITVGATSLQFGELQPWADLSGVGVGFPVAIVNANNSVTMTNGAPISNDPGYTSRYDPAKKTFYISFTWGGGPGSRLATDTLVYIGPRP